MSEDDIAEHDPLQCTCFDCLRGAGYGLQQEDETQQRESAGGDSVMGLTVFSFGGGVQSTAALVLAAQGKLQVDAFLFANVGEKSENPATLRYVHEVAMPYAKAHGIQLIELRRIRRDGTSEDLYDRIMSGKRGLVIPVHLQGSGPMRRQCTVDFKIAVINRWLREHGATASNPATVMLGISTNEELRAARQHDGPRYRQVTYPLLAPDVRMSRMDCINVIVGAGLPIPPKSSCHFCPYHTLQAWRDLRDDQPDVFVQDVRLEQHLTDWSLKRGHRPVYLSSQQRPLPQVVGNASQPRLFEDETCESGYCMV